MIKKAIKLGLNSLNEFLLYGNVRQLKTTELEFRNKIIKNKNFTPVFFLSTGRTGTDFFTKLLSKSNKIKVFHSPSSLICNSHSELIEQGKISYEIYKTLGTNDIIANKLIGQILLASREELIYKTYLHNKSYIETNNRITFLAPAIKYIFPHAKFIHLYRHPGEFIRSGIRRKYYKSNIIHEIGRLKPIKNSSFSTKWNNLDDIEKISWLWNETNSFIDEYLKTIPSESYLKFNFNNLSSENVNKLLKFLNIDDISIDEISKSILKPTNIQKNGSFPKYDEWKESDKQKVKRICGTLSQKYGYIL